MSVEKLNDSEVRCYINNGCARCPFCGSSNLVGEGVFVDAATATQDVTCIDCEEAWTDVYRLDRVEFYVPNQAA